MGYIALKSSAIRRIFAVEKSAATEFLDLAARAEPIARKLAAIIRANWPVKFSHVTESAQPFLAATLAGKWHRVAADDRRQHAGATTSWIICPSVHSQEFFHQALLNWRPDALFLPEAEFAAMENVLPDPEIAAERLALFSLLAHEPGPRLIVEIGRAHV